MRTLGVVGLSMAVAGAAATSLAACSSPSTQRGDATGLTIIAGSTDTPSPSGTPQESGGATIGSQVVGGGQVSASASAAVGTAAPRARGTSTPSRKAGSSAPKSGGSSATTTAASSGTTTSPLPALPSVVSFKVQIQPTCLAGGVAGKPVRLAWQVANATEADLSADAPVGDVGSLKKGLPTSGWLDVAFMCSGPPGSTETHVFDLYAVSGQNHPSSELTVSAKIPSASTPTTTTSSPTTPTSTPSTGM
jgi:hypothetical protein